MRIWPPPPSQHLAPEPPRLGIVIPASTKPDHALSDKAHDPLLRGAWYIEAGFGLLDGRRGLFASFDEAIASIERDLS